MTYTPRRLVVLDKETSLKDFWDWTSSGKASSSRCEPVLLQAVDSQFLTACSCDHMVSNSLSDVSFLSTTLAPWTIKRICQCFGSILMLGSAGVISCWRSHSGKLQKRSWSISQDLLNWEFGGDANLQKARLVIHTLSLWTRISSQQINYWSSCKYATADLTSRTRPRFYVDLGLDKIRLF